MNEIFSVVREFKLGYRKRRLTLNFNSRECQQQPVFCIHFLFSIHSRMKFDLNVCVRVYALNEGIVRNNTFVENSTELSQPTFYRWHFWLLTECEASNLDWFQMDKIMWNKMNGMHICITQKNRDNSINGMLKCLKMDCELGYLRSLEHFHGWTTMPAVESNIEIFLICVM